MISNNLVVTLLAAVASLVFFAWLLKQNWDKLIGKVILDCHNICPLEGGIIFDSAFIE